MLLSCFYHDLCQNKLHHKGGVRHETSLMRQTLSGNERARAQGASAARMGIKLLEVCLSIPDYSRLCSLRRATDYSGNYASILAASLERWLGTRLVHTYYKRRKLGGLLGTTTKSVRIILLFFKYFTGRLGRSESSYPWKKALFCSLKVHTLKNSPPRYARRNYFTFFRHASRGTTWPLHSKFASYAYE